MIKNIFHKFVRRVYFSLFSRTYEIYTDGSSKNGWGSWAYVILEGPGFRGQQKFLIEAAARERRADCHRMEFQAAIEALRVVPRGSKGFLYSDSRILIEAIQSLPRWRRQHWRQASGRAIFNLEQVRILAQLLSVRQIECRWIRGHAGIRGNERCDHLCREARAGSFTGSAAGAPFSPAKTSKTL